MWEKIIAFGTIILILLTSVLVWLGFSRPAINWPLLGAMLIVLLGLAFTAILNFRSAKLRTRILSVPNMEPIANSTPLSKRLYVGADGTPVAISGDTIRINVVIFSSRATELRYLKVVLLDSIVIDNSEPMKIAAFDPFHRTIRRTLMPNEIQKIEHGMTILAVGLAKFSDAAEVTFNFATVVFRSAA